jgi:uncharacterized membrane protein
MLAYLHPLTGVLIVAVLFYTGSLGLRARNDRRRARQLLRLHARLGPPVFVLMLLAWLGGVLSTWLLRPGLELGASSHMRIGTFLVVALTGAFATSRVMRAPAVRLIHPWLGAAAMLLAAAQVFFGLQITP